MNVKVKFISNIWIPSTPHQNKNLISFNLLSYTIESVQIKLNHLCFQHLQFQCSYDSSKAGKDMANKQ